MFCFRPLSFHKLCVHMHVNKKNLKETNGSRVFIT